MEQKRANRLGDILLAENLTFQEAGNLTVPEFIQILGKYNASALNLKSKDHELFAEVYKRIVNKDYSIEDKGKLLEKLTEILFQKGLCGIIECRKNCRTSSNEIDLLLTWTEEARFSGYNSIFSCFGDSFLCECKNYKGKVSVTYVGKFCSLLMTSETSFGIMVSWEGISGRSPWSDANGLIKKIALRENIYIIVIDKNDLKEIYDKKKNIFSIAYDKYMALKQDIEYSQYIKTHEAERKINADAPNE